MTESRIYRQGDVLVRSVSAIPLSAEPVAREDGRLVLAHGEMTGHAHAIDAPEVEATLLSAGQEARFLRLMSEATVRHEEHAPMSLPAGSYEVILQREWTDIDEDAANERMRYEYD